MICARAPAGGRCLGVEAVGPAPAGDDVGLFIFEGYGGVFNGAGGAGGVVGDCAQVGGYPGEVERGHGTEQVIAVEGAEVKGKGEVVDDARPKVVLDGEVVGRELGELLEGETRLGWKDEGPDLLEVVLCEVEAFDHVVDFGRGQSWIEGRGRGRAGRPEGEASGALPEGGLGVDVGKEGAGDAGKEGVEVGLGGWRGGWNGISGGNLADGEACDGGFGYRPEQSSTLAEADETLGAGQEALCHAGGEGGVDG